MQSTDQGRCYVPRRYLTVVMVTLISIFTVGIRTCITLILTHVTTDSQTSNLIFSECTVFNSSTDMNVDIDGDVMLMFHTAFYIGYTLFLIPSSMISLAVSTKTIAGVGMLGYGITTFLHPFAIPYSVPLTFVLRTLQGMLTAVFRTVTMMIVTAWAPRPERSRLFCLVEFGCFIGPVPSLVLTSATLCFLSWDAIFYFLGSGSVLWGVTWLCFFYGNPNLHPNMSLEERRYLGEEGENVQQSSIEMMKSCPWREVLTCKGVWAIFFAGLARHLVFSIITMEQSQYFQDAFDIKAEDIGILLILPFLGVAMASLVSGYVSDKILALGFSTTNTRKVVYAIGCGGEAMSMLALYFAGSWEVALSFIFTGSVLGGFGAAGYLPLASEMAPQYAGVISGLSGTGTVGGVITTAISSQTAGKEKTLESWQYVYLMVGVLCTLCTILFFILADATRQSWAEGKPRVSASFEKQNPETRQLCNRDDDDTSSDAPDEPSASLLSLCHCCNSASHQRKETSETCVKGYGTVRYESLDQEVSSEGP